MDTKMIVSQLFLMTHKDRLKKSKLRRSPYRLWRLRYEKSIHTTLRLLCKKDNVCLDGANFGIINIDIFNEAII